MRQPRGILVLEGADASGKTTLARFLAARYGARYVHSTVRRHVWPWHVGALRLAARYADEGLVVLDRHWLSEQAYGQAFRDGPQYNLGARCLDRVLQRFGAITVLCAPRDLERQLSRHGELKRTRREHFDRIERVVQLYADLRDGNLAHPGTTYLDQLIRFGDYAKRTDVLVYDLDRDGRDLDLFTVKLLSRLRSYRLAQVPAGLDSARYNLAGHRLRARYLFVGERVSPQVRPGHPRWPFCWHDGLSAATYLNRALHAAAFDETTALWTNALEADEQLAGLLKLNLRVVALGRVAESRVRELGGDPRHLCHPQYARRFEAGRDDYGQRLLEAMR